MKFFLVLTTFILVNSISTAPTNSTNEDVLLCLEEFYYAAYNLKFNCTERYEFFSNDLTTQHNSFKVGKECFLQVVQEKCTTEQYDLLVSKYDDFLRALTTVPTNDPECTSTYYSYNSARCFAMMKRTKLDSSEVYFASEVKQNDPKLLKTIALCYETEECLASSCISPDVARKEIETTCDTMELRNSAYYMCIKAIEKELPHMSRYKCLGGVSYNDPSIYVQKKLWTENKSCVKEILEDQCGKKAVENFDKYSAMTAKGFEMLSG